MNRSSKPQSTPQQADQRQSKSGSKQQGRQIPGTGFTGPAGDPVEGPRDIKK